MKRRRRSPLRRLAGPLLLAAALCMAAAPPAEPPGADRFASADWRLLSRDAYSPATLTDFCNGAAPLFEAYGFESLTHERFEAGESREVAVERYAMRDAASAYGLFSFFLATAPVEIGPLLASWSDGVGLLLSGNRFFRVEGLPAGGFHLEARSLAARGAPPARPPDEVAGRLGGPGVRLARILPGVAHLENHLPFVAALPSLASAAGFLLLQGEHGAAPFFELLVRPAGRPFALAPLAGELPDAGFRDVRRLGDRITATHRRGTVELRLEGAALLIRSIP